MTAAAPVIGQAWITVCDTSGAVHAAVPDIAGTGPEQLEAVAEVEPGQAGAGVGDAALAWADRLADVVRGAATRRAARERRIDTPLVNSRGRGRAQRGPWPHRAGAGAQGSATLAGAGASAAVGVRIAPAAEANALQEAQALVAGGAGTVTVLAAGVGARGRRGGGNPRAADLRRGVRGQRSGRNPSRG